MADSWDDDVTATTEFAEPVSASNAERIRPCVKVLTGSATGQVVKLSPRGIAIGRTHSVDLKLSDDGISRTHALIRYRDGKPFVEDAGSRNGTFVNGTRITEPTPLADGDRIQLGANTVLRFAYHDALEDSFHDTLLSSALRDPLTRLFNKRYLMDRLDSELKFARRHEVAVSLLILDLDHFKRINDEHGHLAGDAVLAKLASVLVRAVRNEDVVARFGGEEFVIILRAISLELATQLGDRLRRLVEATTVEHNDLALRVTVSIGVAGYPSTPANAVCDLVEAADQALYRAKHAGRNRVAR